MINEVLQHFGLRLARITKDSAHSASLGQFSTAYEAAMLSLLSLRGKLKIVIVGANDGKIVDPAYNFINMYPDRTEALLVEPQKMLIPYLRQNYSFHQNAKIANVAIGSKGDMVLYSVKEEYHPICQNDATKNWPSYAAPSGITSGDRGHVERWLSRFLKNPTEISAAIEETRVPAKPLRDVLVEVNFGAEIDVLQIDTEGFDDKVLYNSNIESYRPKIIFFEYENLSTDKKRKVIHFLDEFGYQYIAERINVLAVRVGAC